MRYQNMDGAPNPSHKEGSGKKKKKHHHHLSHTHKAADAEIHPESSNNPNAPNNVDTESRKSGGVENGSARGVGDSGVTGNGGVEVGSSLRETTAPETAGETVVTHRKHQRQLSNGCSGGAHS